MSPAQIAGPYNQKLNKYLLKDAKLRGNFFMQQKLIDTHELILMPVTIITNIYYVPSFALSAL